MLSTKLRKRRLGCAIGLAVALLLAAWLALAAWHDTMAEPVVRRTTVQLPGMAMDAEPVTIALLSDLHPAQPNMPPERLARIVAQVNALHPDAIVLAGDFVSDPGLGLSPYPIAASIAPLGKLRAPLGVYAVLGNHDHWDHHDAVSGELARQGVTLLSNAARQAGPLAIGGLDDLVTGHARLGATLAAMRGLPGGRVLVSHSPDAFARLPANTGLMLAGHTHCGQIRLFGWAPVTNSRYGGRYVCGVVRERGNVLVVTAGLGTSVVPVRLGAVPDIWLIEARPQTATKKAAER
jgi:predicted MPP superfamily phosphohydrolase